MRRNGFTLIELAVVLAIIAVLAGILTPLVTGYLEQARVARAQADLRTIADSIKLHQRDTGRYPIYKAGGYPSPDYGGDPSLIIFGGPGNVPPEVPGTWQLDTQLASTTLESWINGNFSNVSTTNIFPKTAFRGPYVGPIESDPWGNKYLLTAYALSDDGSGNHAYVISAGPDGTLDTTTLQSKLVPLVIGGDDIVSVIR
jgi:general secretion pathway protein G